MTKLEKLIMSDEAECLMNEIRNINISIEAKSFTKEEEKYYTKRKKDMIRRLNEIMEL